MKLTVAVEVNGRYETVRVSMELKEPLQQAFEPVDVCDLPSMAALAGGITSTQMPIIMQRRKDIAQIISGEITAHILDIMSANDLKNGYKKEV